MSVEAYLRRGTVEQHATYVGNCGEMTIVTDAPQFRIHNGITPGGIIVQIPEHAYSILRNAYLMNERRW